MRRTGLLFLSMLLVAALAACGGGTPTPAAPAGGDSPPPAAPVAPALPALSQSVTSNNGVSVSYPEGWLDPVATVGVFLYNNADGQSTMNFMRSRPGGLAFQINVQPNSSNQTPEEFFDFMFGNLASGMSITLGEKQAVTLGDAAGLKASGANTDAASRIAIFVAIKPVSDTHYATMVVYLEPDEIETHTPLMEAILASVTYAP